jgi:pimeloyl-ACP methyl ester carboxylesterase
MSTADGFRRRDPSPASSISPEFDLARAGGISPEDSVALYDDRVFVISDLHGGRMLHEHAGGRLALDPDAGVWIHSLEANGRLTAWNSSPTAEDITARDFDGQRWTADRDRRRSFPAVSAERHPTEPITFQSRRVAPGRSACRVVRDDGTVLARWSGPLASRGVWSGDRLWYLDEDWPCQRLVGRAGDHAGGFPVVEQHRLPPGILSSFVSEGPVAAGIWTDPATPASLVVAPTVEELVESVVATSDGVGDDGDGDGGRPYRSYCGLVAGVPCVLYTPPTGSVGTLLMLHGGPHALSWPVFSPLVAFLCGTGWRVVTPNVSSSGMGSRAGAAPECELGVDDAGDVVRLAAALGGGGPVAVAGWSYGAYVAARAVALGMPAAGLVALGGFFSPETVNEAHPAIAPFLRAYHLPRTEADDIAHVPVLAIHGRHDERIDVAAHRDYVRRLPSGTFLDLPDDGHLIMTDGGAAIAYPALAAWLAGLP